MPYDLGKVVNSSAAWLSGAPAVHAVVDNPMYTTLLIVAIVAVVAIASFHEQLRRVAPRRKVRALVYTFMSVLAVVALHHYTTIRSVQQAAAQRGVRDVFSSMDLGRVGGNGLMPDAVPVRPAGIDGRGLRDFADQAGESDFVGAHDRTPGAYDRTPGAYDRTPGAYDRTPGAYDRTPGAYDRTLGAFDRHVRAASNDRHAPSAFDRHVRTADRDPAGARHDGVLDISGLELADAPLPR